jgi:hypothetical protein
VTSEPLINAPNILELSGLISKSVELAELTVVHISTEEQPADMLTKPLPSKKFVYFRDMVMGGEKLQTYFEK